MTIVPILILNVAALLNACDAGPSRSTTTVAPQGRISLLATSEAGWDRATNSRPERDDPSVFLCEDEDQDDTFDDAPLAWGHGRDSAAPPIDAASLCAGRRAIRIASRLASPTLRLRC